MKALIHVNLKPGVLDPQGKAIAGALGRLGFDAVEDARQGKVIELDLKDTVSRDEAEEQVRAMCEALLANTVIERYDIEIVS